MLDFPELGMEAVWSIEVVDFPAFVVGDDKGNDFFAETMRPIATSIPVACALTYTSFAVQLTCSTRSRSFPL